MSDKTVEEMVDYHAGFIFTAGDNSIGLDESGAEYDHSFATENGRVSWEKTGEDEYLVTFVLFGDLENTIEKRSLTSKQISDWFYTPTSKYYEENILNVPIQ